MSSAGGESGLHLQALPVVSRRSEVIWMQFLHEVIATVSASLYVVRVCVCVCVCVCVETPRWHLGASGKLQRKGFVTW